MDFISNIIRRLSKQNGGKLEMLQETNVGETTSAVGLSNPELTISTFQSSSKEGRSFKLNEAGRSYHGIDDVQYVLPNDDDENDRLHEQHWILRYIFQCNYHAPVTHMLEEGITVLDSGCGPATWLFELAEKFPKCKFFGADISFVFPELIKPANVELVIANVAKGIPFPDNTFDYIHQRLLVGALTSDNWESVIKEFYRVLKPGGYIELQELDVQNYLNVGGPHMLKLQDVSRRMCASRGFPDSICNKLKEQLNKAGFVDQNLQIFTLPLNHSGKGGELWWKDSRHALANLRPALARMNSEWEAAENFEQFLDMCGEEANQFGSSMVWYAYYAQKPTTSDN